jgi:hypothetical protein
MIGQAWIYEVSKILAASYPVQMEGDRIIVTAPSGLIYYIDYINKNRFNLSGKNREGECWFAINGPEKDVNFIISLIGNSF